MKKAKIMLMAITVIAIAGGALAFKARTFELFDLCTTTLQAAANPCPNNGTSISLQSTAELELDNPAFCYTVINHDIANDDATCQEIAAPNKGAFPSGN